MSVVEERRGTLCLRAADIERRGKTTAEVTPVCPYVYRCDLLGQPCVAIGTQFANDAE